MSYCTAQICDRDFWNSTYFGSKRIGGCFMQEFLKTTKLFGVSLSTVISFGKRGIKLYGAHNVAVALVAAAVLIVLKIFGFLNIGNLPKIGYKKAAKNEKSALKGKNIIFLGSSVTRGMAAQGKSFVDMLAEHTGANVIKEAVSGTTLVEQGKKNYIARLKKLDKNTPCDVFVCQLSTNDATKKKPIGTISASKDIASFDTNTVCGAIEYIIAYAKQTRNCPVVFYTSPYYASAYYQEMVDALYLISKKWNIEVIDLWNDDAFNAKKNKKHFCMNDNIHPTRKGYTAWVPVFEAGLTNVLAGKPIAKPHGSVPPLDKIKKDQRKHLLVSVLKYILVIVLAVCLALGYAGFQTLSNTTGIAKPGNSDKYNVENVATKADSPIEGKTILFLGSSVTQGYASGGVSFVDYIEKIDNANVIKEVYSGTTVAYTNAGYAKAENSYNPRLQKYDASTPVEAVVIQLSSNDSTSGAPLGEVSDTFELSEIDNSTFTGGMEALIAYAKETWDCPIIVYANPEFRVKTFYDGDSYYNMVKKCQEVVDKWDVYYLNMWEDPDFKAASLSDYRFWMSDPVHPTKAGYLEWWTPAFEEALYSFFE